MAFEEALADRVRPLLAGASGVAEKNMFGGRAFLGHGNMPVSLHGAELIVRIDPAETEKALEQPGTRIFDITGRPPMKGWILVAPEALHDKKGLAAWMKRDVAYASSLPAK